MKKNLHLFLVVITFLATTGIKIHGQALRQVLFSTGGTFLASGNKVKLYSFNPVNNQLDVADSIYGDFSNDLITDSGYAYLHVGRASGSPYGQDIIIKYNLNTHQRIDSIENVPGVQRMTVTPSHLVVTFGYGAASDYVRFYDKQTLSPVYTDATLPYMTASAVYLNDSIYVAFNRNDSGAVAVYSENNPARHRIRMFDTLSAGINSTGTDGSSIFLLSEKFNFTTFSISYGGITRFNPLTNTYQAVADDAASGLITISQDTLFASFGTVNAYHTGGLVPLSFDLQSTYTDAVYDTHYKKYFVVETDYFSFGRMAVYNRNGTLTSTSFNTDISGAAIALDYFGYPLSDRLIQSKSSKNIYPNPAIDRIFIDKSIHEYSILDMRGKTIHSGNARSAGTVDISTISPGTYFIIDLATGSRTKFVKL